MVLTPGSYSVAGCRISLHSPLDVAMGRYGILPRESTGQQSRVCIVAPLSHVPAPLRYLRMYSPDR